MRVQVAIVGGGPAGHLLGQLLYKAGISAIVIEQRSQDYVLGRIRAGRARARHDRPARRSRRGQPHARRGPGARRYSLSFGGAHHRIDLQQLTGGKSVMVYGQTEVTRDLMKRARRGGPGHRL